METTDARVPVRSSLSRTEAIKLIGQPDQRFGILNSVPSGPVQRDHQLAQPCPAVAKRVDTAAPGPLSRSAAVGNRDTGIDGTSG